jgi:enoyl-CoA hydratase/carnithine racemase
MLHSDVDASLLTVRIDHGKANALDQELLEGLAAALGRLEEDAGLRAAVLTGAGHIFSAGVDLHRVLEGGPGYVRTFVPLLAATLHRLFACPKPVVAAINGHAIAGGCALAAACDYRIMARGPGTIGVPELRVGLPFPLVAIEILRFATSTAHLQELVYQGTTYTTDAAYERGLVDEVVAPEEVVNRARAVALRLAAEPVARFRLTKQQLRAPTLAAIAAHAAETDAAVLREWQRPETVAAIRAYLDARRRR